MKVLVDSKYPVEFENNEIEAIQEAANILTTFHETMKKQNCTILEGGYNDCPYCFGVQELKDTANKLYDFIEHVPHTMY